MRTIRGLQITSFVVLSPILLCMISLISILFTSIIGWILPSTKSFPVKKVIQPRNNNHSIFNKLQFIFRLRYSSVTLVILALYLFYILFKKKRNKNPQDVLFDENPEEEILNKKRKNLKRRKCKKISTTKPENHHHYVHSKPPPINNTILHKNHERTTIDEDNWIHVKHHKDHQLEQDDDWNHQQDNTVLQKSEYQDTFNPQQDYQETFNVKQLPEEPVLYHDNNIWNNNNSMELDNDWRQMHIKKDATPELTPIESEDEDHKQYKNWYSPFSTGLDLDILPKYNTSPELDPLTLKYDTILPPVISTIYSTKRPSSIEILENYPYIPSSPHHHSFTTHLFGPIGDKKK